MSTPDSTKRIQGDLQGNLAPQRRKLVKQGVAVASSAILGAPAISLAQNKPIKIGMPTILSGRVATLGISSRNAVMMEVEKFNAAGGLNGRKIEMVVRDSKGQPQEAARVARELVNTDGCEMILDAEASSGAFAVHEVARDLGVLCVHTVAETTSLTADPKLRAPNIFRVARIGIHDSIVGGGYAAKLAKEKNLRTWMTCSPDYAYGRDTTAEFLMYLKRFNKDIEVTGELWPKLTQADYSEVITRMVQNKPQAVYSCLWGGDLTSFIDQASIFGAFNNLNFFSVNMADYTVLTATKNVPNNLHSGNRFLRSYPATQANRDWADAYFAKYKEMPTNWSWENAVGINFLTAAMKKTNSSDGKKMAAAMKGMTINSPFGSNGTLTLRAEDHTLVDYAIGWGPLIAKEPYMPIPTVGDWKQIKELEAEWKKSKGWT